MRALYGLLLCLRHTRDASQQALYDDTVTRIITQYSTASTAELTAIVKEAITQ